MCEIDRIRTKLRIIKSEITIAGLRSTYVIRSMEHERNSMKIHRSKFSLHSIVMISHWATYPLNAVRARRLLIFVKYTSNKQFIFDHLLCISINFFRSLFFHKCDLINRIFVRLSLGHTQSRHLRQWKLKICSST